MSAIRNQKREEWILAAARLLTRSSKHVECPECGAPALQVRDVEYGIGSRKGLDRYLSCLQCGRDNIVNLRHAGTYFETHRIAAE
jgi:transcription elongation factor Elf1